MKRTIHLFSLALIVSLLISGVGFPIILAQASGTWEYVGTAGFSDGPARSTSIAVDNGTPYVAFQDYAHGGKASVMKYNTLTGNWEYVGVPGFTGGDADYISFRFNGGTPYLAFRDWANVATKGVTVSVMKFDALTGNWVYVGPAGLSDHDSGDPSLAFDNGTPYVAFTEFSPIGGNLGRVMKFNAISGNWENIGSGGFAGDVSGGISLAFDNSMPYVAYSGGNSDKANVVKFDTLTGSWVKVGPANFTADITLGTSLVFDQGVPYLATSVYSAQDELFEANVFKFNGTDWVNVGLANFSPGEADSISLAFNSGVPYVAFLDGVHSMVSVMKSDALAGSWVDMGRVGFSLGDSASPSFAFDNGIPYVAFADWDNSDKASVMKYVDGMPATAPTISSPISPTNDSTPTISGSADPGNQVTVWYADSTSNWVQVCKNILADATTGAWICPWPSAPFPAIAEGDFSLKAKAFNGTNHSPDTVVNEVLDLTAPSAPLIKTPSGVTNDTTPTISGTAEVLSHVNVSYVNETDIAVPVCQDIPVDGSGNWSCDSSLTLPARKIQLVANATDPAGNLSTNASYFFEIDVEGPTVASIMRSSSNLTSAASVDFAVTFSEAVSGVDATDFALTTAGVQGATVKSVTGTGSSYTVSVNTGAGNGMIRLNVVDDDSIQDLATNPLGGMGSGNGDYTNGEVYKILKGADTAGVFRPMNGLLYLKNKNETGFAELELNYGIPGDYPVVGDWDGNGTVTIGVYRQGKFYLRNSNSVGFADAVFAFGQIGDQPVAGDWDGDGIDTIGVYRPSTGQFLLRNTNDAGPADASFYLGNVGDVGIAGDWNGDGIDTVGVFRPINGIIFLKNTNETGYAEIALNYGIPGDKPVVGDWNNDGIDTIGVYRNGQFMLRDSNTVGFADYVFGLGNPGDMPIAGNWDALP